MDASTAPANAVCTVITADFLPEARALQLSLRHTNPETAFVIFLVDEASTRYGDPDDLSIYVTSETLREHFNIATMWDYYSSFELCTALRPFAISYMLDRWQLQRVVYLDTDVWVTGSFAPIWAGLDAAAFGCCPHITRPYPADGKRPAEFAFTQFGTFNYGFLAFSNALAAHQVLRYLRERMSRYAFWEPPVFHGGQEHLDLASVLFRSDFWLVDHPGCNIAYWNLGERKLEQSDGRITANGLDAIFFHLSGHDLDDPSRLTRFPGRFSFETHPVLTSVYRDYRAAVERFAENGRPTRRPWTEAASPKARRRYLYLKGSDDGYTEAVAAPLADPVVFNQVPAQRQDARRIMIGKTARVLCLSPFEMECPNAGNRVRVGNMMHALAESGHIVKSFTFRSSMNAPADRDSLPLDGWYTDALEREVLDVVRTFRPEVVILHYAYFSRLLDLVGSSAVLKVIDTLDVFTRRNQKFRALGIDYEGLLPSFSTSDAEARALNRADVVIGIHEGESAFFRSICAKPVVTIGHVVAPTPVTVVHDDARRMIYVGSRSLVGGYHLQHFAERIFPAVRRTHGDATLAVVGGVGDMMKDLPRGCHRVPFTHRLDACYERADLAVNSDQCATGLSIKNVTALAHGCPLVTTRIGARGLAADTGAFLCADDDREFADLTVAVLSNRDMRRRLSENALRYTAARLEENVDRLRTLVA